MDVEIPLQSFPSDKHIHLNPLSAALAEVAAYRAKLASIGARPDHDALENARAALSLIAARLSQQLEDIFTMAPPKGVDVSSWQSEKEKEARAAAEADKLPYNAVIQLNELHLSFESLLKKAEDDLVRLSISPDNKPADDSTQFDSVKEGVNSKVVDILREAKERSLEAIDLRGCDLAHLPEAFGKFSGLVTLDLSNNLLKALPESIGGLMALQSLIVESNRLERLPDSVGLLKNLKFLNVTKNHLTAFPDSILQCSSLVEIKAGFNRLEYLPTKIGFHLVNLEHFTLQLNKLRVLPSSICNLKSLRFLDVNFNQLQSLPMALGNLASLEFLDASKNFHDLESVPDSIGDLFFLADLNLSYNQIRVLPDSFWRLQNLKKLNLEENPLIVPPMDIVNAGVEAVLAYMKERWEIRVAQEQEESEPQESTEQTTWVPWWLGGSWITKPFSGASTGLQKESQDYLNEQL